MRRYSHHGNTHIEPTTFSTGIGDIALPEFDVFLNPENISIKGAGTLIRETGAIYQVEYEKPVKGNLKGAEISLSAYKLLKDKWHIGGKARYSLLRKNSLKQHLFFMRKNVILFLWKEIKDLGKSILHLVKK